MLRESKVGVRYDTKIFRVGRWKDGSSISCVGCSIVEIILIGDISSFLFGQVEGMRYFIEQKSGVI